ncbi:glycosyltransferase family 2 protein [Epibacterium ulvae]|uniref:glycosyltransferase family 2 protein n=1 Tax=Epibacterium ulvae TaxID=1156985 RepID=UPI00248FB840|nr:glycosyltransferase family 2 protein [Epibacterium ulvae]
MNPTRWFRTFKWKRRVQSCLKDIQQRVDVSADPHGLNAPLIVSLTSFAPRFPSLLPTLQCLLRQSVKPDQVILWLSPEDAAQLPTEIKALKNEGLSIALCEDWRSFKKIIPALQQDPNRYIVTADDDVFYPFDWLAKLVEGAKQHPGNVISHRAHRVQYEPSGSIAPYENWQKNLNTQQSGADIFATGVSGVLYPPNSLDQHAIETDAFLSLCPSADDIWLYWMTRLNGCEVHNLGGKARIIEWPGSQTVSLLSENAGGDGLGGNDRAIRALTRAYGLPGKRMQTTP